MKHRVIRALGFWVAALLSAGIATAATTTLRVVPPESPINPGTTFTVDIAVSDASNLGSFQFIFGYNPAVLKFEKMALGEFLGSTGRTANPLGPRVDESAGQVTFGAFTLGQQPGASGSGQLATVTLRALAGGTSPLEIRDPQITDIMGGLQPVTAQNSQITVSGSPAAAVTLSQAEPVTGPASPAGRATTADDQSGMSLILGIGVLLILAIIVLVIVARRRQPQG